MLPQGLTESGTEEEREGAVGGERAPALVAQVTHHRRIMWKHSGDGQDQENGGEGQKHLT